MNKPVRDGLRTVGGHGKILLFSLMVPFLGAHAVEAGLTIVPAPGGATATGREPEIETGNVRQVVPRGDYASATALQRQFDEVPLDELELMQFSSSICAALACGTLSEQKASQLLDRFKQGVSAEAEARRRLLDRLFALGNLTIAASALVVSWTARRRAAPVVKA